jgi:ubiquinone biosynthesis protein Coq4
MKSLVRALARRVMGWVYVFSAVVHAVRLLLDPNRLGDVFILDRAISTPDVLDRIAARVRSDPAAAAALRRRRRLEPLDLDRLGAMAHGTLGRAVADFLRKRGLNPNDLPRKDDWDETSYVQAHLYETHDIWHVVTGFDTDVAGELGLQAFYSAQLDGPLPRYLLVGGLVQSRVWAPEDWGRRLDAIARGWTLGRRARPLFGQAWDDLWGQPLERVRRDVGITERPEPAMLMAASA